MCLQERNQCPSSTSRGWEKQNKTLHSEQRFFPIFVHEAIFLCKKKREKKLLVSSNNHYQQSAISRIYYKTVTHIYVFYKTKIILKIQSQNFLERPLKPHTSCILKTTYLIFELQNI